MVFVRNGKGLALPAGHGHSRGYATVATQHLDPRKGRALFLCPIDLRRMIPTTPCVVVEVRLTQPRHKIVVKHQRYGNMSAAATWYSNSRSHALHVGRKS